MRVVFDNWNKIKMFKKKRIKCTFINWSFFVTMEVAKSGQFSLHGIMNASNKRVGKITGNG